MPTSHHQIILNYFDLQQVFFNSLTIYLDLAWNYLLWSEFSFRFVMLHYFEVNISFILSLNASSDMWWSLLF